MAAAPTIDAARLQDFMGRFVQDLGAGTTAPLVVLGDKLGLYKALASSGALSSTALAEQTGTAERWVAADLAAQAAAGGQAPQPVSAAYSSMRLLANVLYESRRKCGV